MATSSSWTRSRVRSRSSFPTPSWPNGARRGSRARPTTSRARSGATRRPSATPRRVRSSIPEPGWKLTSLPTSDRPGDRRAALIAGAAIYVLALALRLLPVFVFPSIHYPDEIFQAVEQAHRLVYGTGLVPWEFVYGTRSWLLPGTIAWLMEFARHAVEAPSPQESAERARRRQRGEGDADHRHVEIRPVAGAFAALW